MRLLFVFVILCDLLVGLGCICSFVLFTVIMICVLGYCIGLGFIRLAMCL